MASAQHPVHYQHYHPSTGWEPVEAQVIQESTVTLTVNGDVWLSFACTPTQLDRLAAGFLYNEGIIHSRAEIALIDVCHQQTNVDIWLNHPVQRPQNWQRTSGCTGGFTSTSSEAADAVLPDTGRSSCSEPLSPEMLLSGMEQLLQAQDLYRESGGVHCSAILEGGQIRVRAEDIGRHNTLDKLAGELLLGELHFDSTIILTTGRISSEMLQKSARMGACVVVSRTSPTSKSVLLAERLGITLVGYARRNGFTVYAHPERLMVPTPARAPALQPGQTPPGC